MLNQQDEGFNRKLWPQVIVIFIFVLVFKQSFENMMHFCKFINIENMT